jgi:hypothetical protein
LSEWPAASLRRKLDIDLARIKPAGLVDHAQLEVSRRRRRPRHRVGRSPFADQPAVRKPEQAVLGGERIGAQRQRRLSEDRAGFLPRRPEFPLRWRSGPSDAPSEGSMMSKKEITPEQLNGIGVGHFPGYLGIQITRVGNGEVAAW